MGIFGPLISRISSDLMSTAPPAALARGHPLPAVTLKFKDDRYTDMGIDFGVNWAADFDNAISLILGPHPRPLAKGHPPPAVTPKFK